MSPDIQVIAPRLLLELVTVRTSYLDLLPNIAIISSENTECLLIVAHLSLLLVSLNSSQLRPVLRSSKFFSLHFSQASIDIIIRCYEAPLSGFCVLVPDPMTGSCGSTRIISQAGADMLSSCLTITGNVVLATNAVGSIKIEGVVSIEGNLTSDQCSAVGQSH